MKLQLNSPTVGPILGHTTAHSVKIWGRGAEQIIDSMPRRCFGAVRYKEWGQDEYGATHFFKMNPNFDLTGIAVITDLIEDSYYEYQIGYFFSDVELDDAKPKKLDWANAKESWFKTASKDDSAERTLAIGSCRYLLKTFLGDFFDDRGDKTFRSIDKLVEDGTEIDQLIMMGDQIYADDLGTLNPDKTIDMFYKRYRDAFSQKYIRELMSKVPTYMTLDDHEIEDNWPSKATSKDERTLYPVAIHAYQAYQLSHSPNLQTKNGRLVGPQKHLWYKYTDGCCDFFVTDTRTERLLGQDHERAILGARQMSSLKRWLNNDTGRVKVVVTSVPFFPDPAGHEGNDKWSGFERQRQELIAYIDTREIEKVIFFSGDVHASLSGEIILPSGRKIISVVSSAFFWPYPHPKGHKFKTKGIIESDIVGQCELSNFSPVATVDNFTIVNIDKSRVDVTVRSRKGEILHKHMHSL